MILSSVISELSSLGFSLQNLDFSPIKGPKGNIEFISHFKHKSHVNEEPPDIPLLVKKAHEELKG
jgi:23S rRNA (cytidine1920-2'-O)/16S rRNA (cytidine1409-2'-O)-methyltransferase